MVDSCLLIKNANLIAHLLQYKSHPHGNIACEIQRFAFVKVVVLRVRIPHPQPPGPEQMQQGLVVKQDYVPKVGLLGIVNYLLPRGIFPEGDPTLDDHLSTSNRLSMCLEERWTFPQEVISPRNSISLLGFRCQGNEQISCWWGCSDRYILLNYRTTLGFGILGISTRPFPDN